MEVMGARKRPLSILMPKPKQPYRPNTRKTYEDTYGKLPEGYQVHHILPTRLGGTHDLENLVALTYEEHRQAHLDLYEKYNDWRDLNAVQLIDEEYDEVRLRACSEGGKAAIQKMRELGLPIGFQGISPEFHSKIAAAGGKVGGRVQFEKKLGIHAQTHEERLVAASNGGKRGCLTNGWLDSDVQRSNGAKGGPKNKGFKWYTDGVSSYKYTAKQQGEVAFADCLEQHPEFRAGRLVRHPVEAGKSVNAPRKRALYFREYRARLKREKEAAKTKEDLSKIAE